MSLQPALANDERTAPRRSGRLEDFLPAAEAAALWARRSWFAIDGDRLLVQEVLLPESHS